MQKTETRISTLLFFMLVILPIPTHPIIRCVASTLTPSTIWHSVRVLGIHCRTNNRSNFYARLDCFLSVLILFFDYQ